MIGPQPVLEARDLRVLRGGSLVLDVPSLSIREGEVFALIGPNGAGKSTLLQALCSLLPFQGEIRFRDEKIGEQIPALQYRRRLAMVLQEPFLFNTSVYRNVASGLKIRGMSRADAGPKIMDVLDRFRVAHLKDRSARTLSGGEARRVSLARAFATDPELLFLDEPFSALDPVVREELIEDLERAIRQTGTTTIFVTHDRTEAFRLATRIGVMKDGKILQSGSPEEVMYRPEDGFVASLVGVETILDGDVSRRNGGRVVVSVAGKDLVAAGDAAPGERVTLCIRPENVILSADGGAPKNGGNLLRAKVERIIPLGLYHKVFLNCGFTLITYVTHRAIARLSLKEGAETFASFDAEDVHVIRSAERIGHSETQKVRR